MQETKFKQNTMQSLRSSSPDDSYVKFHEICLFVKGVTYSKLQEKEADTDGYRILRANNITLETYTINYDEVKVIDKKANVKQEQMLKNGDILMCVGSGSKEHIGKVAYINEDTNYYFGGFMGTIRVKDRLISRYLFYILTSKYFKDYLEQVVSCCTINNINSSIMNGFLVPVLPLAEQERIASALTAADNLIASLDKQIAKTRNLKQATMQHLLSSLPNHSPLKPLGEVAEIDKGVQFNRVNMSEKGTFPVFNGGINASGYIEQYNQNENTITVSQGGASAGYVNWQIEKFWAGAHCYVIKSIVEVSNKYLYYFLKYNEVTFMNSKHGGNIPGLAIKFLLDFLIPIPPVEEQKRIASILTAMDNQIVVLEAKRSKYEMVKQGMMQQLLTGTIRLT